MDKKLFNSIDNIKVPEKTKAELFEKIEQQKINQVNKKTNKLNNIFARSKWLFTGIAIGAICMMLAIPIMNQGVDYQQYVKAASQDVTEPYQKLLEEKRALKVKLQNGEITLDEFLAEYDKLQVRVSEIENQRNQLNKEYGIDEKDLERSIKKASAKDKESINAYMSELEKLEAEDEKIDQLEDQLERDYENGKISKKDFIKHMKVLEEKDDELDRKEDRIEKKNNKDDDREDDKDDDDDQDDDAEEDD